MFWSAMFAVIAAGIIGYTLGTHRAQRLLSPFVDSGTAASASKEGAAAVQARIQKRKARILARAKEQGRITNDEVEDMFCISDATARNYLSQLEGEGALTQVGMSGRNVHYTPTH